MDEQAKLIHDQFIARLDEQMQSANCKIWRNPQISPTRTPALFATRIAWSFLRIPVHLFVDCVSNPSPADFVDFFEEGLIYSKRAFSGGKGVKVWGSSFAIVPCIVSEEANADTIMYVRKRHHLWRQHINHWTHGFDYFPVLYTLNSNEVHYWKGMDCIGSAVYPFAHRLVEETVVSVTRSLASPHG